MNFMYSALVSLHRFYCKKYEEKLNKLINSYMSYSVIVVRYTVWTFYKPTLWFYALIQTLCTPQTSCQCEDHRDRIMEYLVAHILLSCSPLRGLPRGYIAKWNITEPLPRYSCPANVKPSASYLSDICCKMRWSTILYLQACMYFEILHIKLWTLKKNIKNTDIHTHTHTHSHRVWRIIPASFKACFIFKTEAQVCWKWCT